MKTETYLGDSETDFLLKIFANVFFSLLQRRMYFDLIETLKMINGICYCDRYFFNISPRTGNLLPLQISETSRHPFGFFFAYRVIFVWEKLSLSDQKLQQCEKKC